MEETPPTSRSFAAALEEGAIAALSPEDLIFVFAPLMRDVAALHAQGKVCKLTPDQIIEDADGRLRLAAADGFDPRYNSSNLRRIQPPVSSALKFAGEYRLTTDQVHGTDVDTMLALAEPPEVLTQPCFIAHYRCWELEAGHHDEIADVFCLGMLLATLSCGFDFRQHQPLKNFASARTNLFIFNSRLHPVIANLIVEMTALDRSQRATDVAALADRLENYRDQPVAPDIDRALDGMTSAPDRRVAVLKHLRDRLFDLSRRNKLIHFKNTQNSINMTVASVPIVARLEAIRADQLCTWQGAFAADVLSCNLLPLQKWMRFEDQPYLPSTVDKIIQEARRDRAEYGFSSLRLVTAFLYWNNLKEAPDEKIMSPLLWLPVELLKKKGVKDQYTLQAHGTVAEVNPALRHYLEQLYDIRLPEFVDLAETTVEEFHKFLSAKIAESEPSVALALETKPEIRLVHEKAVQRMRQHQRRQAHHLRTHQIDRPDFSYDRADYRPLGRALFTRHVKVSPLPQRLAAQENLSVTEQTMAPRAAGSTGYTIGRNDGHRYDWRIDLTQVTLANFNYRKMALVRDYAQLIETAGGLPAFDRIFSVEPRELTSEKPVPLALDQQWDVIAADNSQRAAIAYARSGKSFIIQGPPGTGKSQTITNLIADYVARGKRVLFVCEKRAALDVVLHRLNQAKLGQLCCIIHDAMEDKKEFILDLKQGYESWIKNPAAEIEALAKRADIVAAHDRHISLLQKYEEVLQAAPAEAGSSLRSLVRRLEMLRQHLPDLGTAERAWLPDAGAWDVNMLLTQRVERLAEQKNGLRSLAQNPLARLAPALLAHSDAYDRVTNTLTVALEQLQAVETIIGDGHLTLNLSQPLPVALDLASSAKQLAESGLSSHLACITDESDSWRTLQKQFADIDKLEQALLKAKTEAANWREPLTSEDAQAALAQARAQETAFFSFLSGKWRRLKASVAARYNFEAHAVKPTITSVLEKLLASQEAENRLAAANEKLQLSLGIKDRALFLSCRSEMQQAAPAVQSFLRAAQESADPTRIISQTARALPALEALSATVLQNFYGLEEKPLAQLGEQLRDMQEAQDDLPEYIPLLTALHAAGGQYARCLLTLDLPCQKMEAAVVEEAITRLLRKAPELATMNGRRLLEIGRRAAAARTMMTSANADAICATQHQKLLHNVKRAQTSNTQLDDTGKDFKKNYSMGRRELEHEFAKSMRYRSIRDLSGDETGLVINDLKPVWLMSPLSVSDALPLEANLFDVVIFDEASQIPMEDAVPALCRAPQVIVVGDENQLPPTSFFSSAREDADMRIEAEHEEGGRIAILMDADSLLVQAARNLDGTMLSWHYRSRSESLISFSNAAFYRGGLITIPDQKIPLPQDADDTDQASDTERGSLAAAETLSKPVSFHHLPKSSYNNRTNATEARYIADMLRSLLLGDTRKSIGIVAFSEAQQGEIEDAIDRLAQTDSAFATALESAWVREDDGQFNGLFVKNLENVQGDERDIIILSICYGPDGSGRMAMNFGPINQRGGEKRLNVIFSRSKHHMAVVSSIEGTRITNTHNDGARALQAFLNFAQAHARGNVAQSEAVLGGLNADAGQIFGRSTTEDSLRAAIVTALQLRGLEVHQDIGSGQFRCDIGIVNDAGDAYRLGILLDGKIAPDAHHVEEHHVFRPSILTGFGWRILHLSPLDWLRDREAVIARIMDWLEDDIPEQIDDDPFEGRARPGAPATATPASATAAPAPAALPASDVALTEYRFQEGNSNKFWRIGVHGLTVTVMFGRVGTAGQTVIKQFDTPEQAQREADKLILEKRRKGYVEAEEG
jgi:predicted DNA-binding WGR domain protein